MDRCFSKTRRNDQSQPLRIMIIDFNSFAMVVPHPHRKGTCSTTTSFNIHQKRSVAEWRSCSVILIIYSITPRKLTNVPLKKGPFPKERMNYLPTIIFQGRVVSFFGRSITHIPNSWTIFGPMIPGEIPGDMVTWWPQEPLRLACLHFCRSTPPSPGKKHPSWSRVDSSILPS